MNYFRKYLLKHSRELEIKNGKRIVTRFAYGILGTFLLVVVWALLGPLMFQRPGYQQFSGFLPGPATKALYGLMMDGVFWSSVFSSLCRVVVGIGIALLIGLPVGLLVGYYRKLKLMTNASIQFLRMISPLAWMPIALLLFASFESAIYFLITVATVWPIILNTVVGVSRVNPQWINMARDQGARDHHLILHIVVPASVPYILTSLRLALGVAWIVLVPAEFLGVSSGLGYLINDARDTMEYDRLMAVVIAIGILGFLLDGAIQQVLSRCKWNWVS
jgi:NitT/TauT family transport system permease protein